MKRHSNRDAGVARQFFIQGLLVCLTSIPLYFVFKNQVLLAEGLLSLKNILSIGMISYGIFCEGIADSQLENFKEKKKSGEINQPFCTDGFWRKSRHPNLYFELVLWSGFGFYGDIDSSRFQQIFRCLVIVWAWTPLGHYEISYHSDY